MDARVKSVVRLCMRIEGDWWVAYAAITEDMVDAVEIGRIRLAAAKVTEDGADRFKALMVSIMSQVLTDIGEDLADWEKCLTAEQGR